MLNVLVVDDNFYYSKNLINIISANNSKIRVCNFCTNGKEVIELLRDNTSEIDVILLDLKIPEYNGIDILNYIENNNLEKFKSSIIVISGEIDMITKLRNNPYLYTIINKANGYDVILRELNNLIYIKEEEKNLLIIKYIWN